MFNKPICYDADEEFNRSASRHACAQCGCKVCALALQLVDLKVKGVDGRRADITINFDEVDEIGLRVTAIIAGRKFGIARLYARHGMFRFHCKQLVPFIAYVAWL